MNHLRFVPQKPEQVKFRAQDTVRLWLEELEHQIAHHDNTTRKDLEGSRAALAALGISHDAPGKLHVSQVTKSSIFDWLFQDPQLQQILRSELEMYCHHVRQSGRHSTTYSGDIPNMYYGLFSQVVRQSPLLWLCHLLARDDSNHRLVSIPICAKYHNRADWVQEPLEYRLFEGDTLLLQAKSVCHMVSDEILAISSPASGDAFQYMGFIDGVTMKAWLNSPSCKWLDGPDPLEHIVLAEDDAFIDFMGHHNYTFKPLITDLSGRPEEEKYHPGDVILRRSGTPSRISWPAPVPLSTKKGNSKTKAKPIPGERLVFSSGFAAILPSNDHSSSLFTESGHSVVELRDAHQNCILPQRARFTHRDDLSAVKFPAIVSITGLSEISDALIGSTDWEDPLVAYQAQRLLEGKLEEFFVYEGCYRANAIRKIMQAWDAIQAVEMVSFPGNRSYFRVKEQRDHEEKKRVKERVEIVIPDSDNEILLVEPPVSRKPAIGGGKRKAKSQSSHIVYASDEDSDIYNLSSDEDRAGKRKRGTTVPQAQPIARSQLSTE